MRSFTRILLASAFMLVPLSAAHAEQYLTVGAGWFNFDRSGDSAKDSNSVNFQGEYRGNPFYYGLLPVIGASVNTDGGALGYVGLDYDLQVAPHWSIIPGLAVGAWGKGDSIDLGGTFEFHESIEVDYQFDNQYRLGAQVNHTSNAGIYSHNPGVNALMGTLSIPLGN